MSERWPFKGFFVRQALELKLLGHIFSGEKRFIPFLGGGFEHFLCSPRSLGKGSKLTNIVQMSWFNHQLDFQFMFLSMAVQWDVFLFETNLLGLLVFHSDWNLHCRKRPNQKYQARPVGNYLIDPVGFCQRICLGEPFATPSKLGETWWFPNQFWQLATHPTSTFQGVPNKP